MVAEDTYSTILAGACVGALSEAAVKTLTLPLGAYRSAVVVAVPNVTYAVQLLAVVLSRLDRAGRRRLPP